MNESSVTCDGTAPPLRRRHESHNHRRLGAYSQAEPPGRVVSIGHQMGILNARGPAFTVSPEKASPGLRPVSDSGAFSAVAAWQPCPVAGRHSDAKAVWALRRVEPRISNSARWLSRLGEPRQQRRDRPTATIKPPQGRRHTYFSFSLLSPSWQGRGLTGVAALLASNPPTGGDGFIAVLLLSPRTECGHGGRLCRRDCAFVSEP